MSRTAKKKQVTKARTTAAIAGSQIIKGQAAAARYAGKSERTVRRWVKAGMPRTEEGHYIRGMLDFYKKNEGTEPTKAKFRKEEADAGIREKKDRLLQMELEARQRDMDAELTAALVQRVVILKRSFMGQGRKLAPVLAATRDARKCRKIIDDDNRAIIEAYASQ